LELRPAPLVGLLGQLMATIVLPYRGPTAAGKELERPVPRAPRRDRLQRRAARAASPVDYRLTVRTQMALAAVGGRPGLNNREVSEVIGLADQGQVSRMMKRLGAQGLVENALGRGSRQVKAWRLTADGEAVIDAHRSLKQAQRTTGEGGKLVATRSARCRRGKTVSQKGLDPAKEIQQSLGSPRPFRLTALTHEVLGQVASLSKHGSGPSNLEVAQAAGVKDQGQISKLLARLQSHDLLRNTRGYPAAGNAWQLKPHGEELLHASNPATPREGQ
jgi:DNA-binding MarR family transcriptional regulator